MSQSAEEMLSWVPPYYSESQIYKMQNAAKGTEMDILKYIIDDMKNQFTPEYSTWGLAFWEQLCGIKPFPEEDIEERRRRLMKLLSTMTPLSPSEFITQIKKATGETVKVYYTNWNVESKDEPYGKIENAHLRKTDAGGKGDYIVDIVIEFPTALFDLVSFKDTVYDIIPCHLMIKCSAIVNLETLKRFTHRELKRYTHLQLKNCIPLEEVV